MFKTALLALCCCAYLFGQTTVIGGSRIINGSLNLGTESGSGNTFIVSLGVSALTPGLESKFVATHNNTGAASLNLDSLGAVPIVMSDGVTPIPAGAIQANALTSAVYNGSKFQLSSAATTATTSSGSGVGFNVATATPLYYYPHFGTNVDRYMHQAYSTDAKAFREMSYTDTYQNTVDQKDISMFYDKTAGIHYYAGTSGSTTGVYVWSTKDMVNFSTPTLVNIPGLPMGVTNIWAPEFFADPTSGNEYVFVSVSSNNITSFTTYVVPWTNGTFTGSAQSISISGTSEGYVIDNFPRKIGSNYYLFYSNGSSGHSVQRLAFATSSNLLGPYTQQSSGDLGGFAASIPGGGVEAPTVLLLPSGCNRIYVDTFGPTQNGYVVRWADSCDNFSTFTTPVVLNIDKQSQHGTVYAITDATEAAIINTAIIGSTGGSFKGVSTNTLNLGADVSLTSTGSGLLQFNSPASGMNMIFQPSAPGLHPFQFYDNTVNWGNFDFTDNLGVWDYVYSNKSMRIDVGLQLDSARNYAKPGCDANHRGVLWFLNNGASADDMQLCNSGGSGYTWSSLLQGSGSSSTGAPSGGFVIGSPSNSGYPSLVLQGDTKTWDIEAAQSTSDVPGHLIFNQVGGGRYFDMNATGIPKFPALAASSGTANLCVDSTGLVKNSGCSGSTSAGSSFSPMSTYQAAVLNAKTSPVRILVLGDSESACVFPVCSVGPTNPANVWVNKLRTNLQADLGSHGSGVVPLIAGTTSSTAGMGLVNSLAWTLTGTVTGSNLVGPFQVIGASSGNSLVQMSPGATATMASQMADRFQVYCAETADSASGIQTAVDGTNGPIVCAANAGNIAISATVPTSGLGSHVLKLTALGSGHAYLYAAEALIGTSGLTVDNVSVGGAASTFFSDAPSKLAFIKAQTEPYSLIIVPLGTNDAGQGASVATYTANMQTLLGSFTGTRPSFIVVNENPTSGYAANQAAYYAAAKSIADQNQSLIADLGQRWGSYTQENAAGFAFSDGTHLSDAGQIDWEALMEAMIRPQQQPNDGAINAVFGGVNVTTASSVASSLAVINTSAGGHAWSFNSGGSANAPGAFTFYDQTSGALPLAILGGNTMMPATQKIGWGSSVPYSGINTWMEDVNSGTPSIHGQGLRLDMTGAQPNCDSGHRNWIWLVQAPNGSEDGFQVCHQTTTGFAWKAIY